MPFSVWLTTPAGNATVDSTINWAEGQSSSSVNDSARAMMAALAQWRNDISGLNISSSGTGNAYVCTSSEGLGTPTDGQFFTFIPNVTNTGASTLQLDGGTAHQIWISTAGTQVPAGLISAGTPFPLRYYAAGPAWLTWGIGVSGNVPVGAILPFAGAASPSANWALPAGQSIGNSTTYPALNAIFAAAGYPYGGNSSNLILPDLRGRVLAALDNLNGSAANRITVLGTDNGTIVGAQLASWGGTQNHPIQPGELAQHQHTGAINNGGLSGSAADHLHSVHAVFAGGGLATLGLAYGNDNGLTDTGASDRVLSLSGSVIDPNFATSFYPPSPPNFMALLQPTIIVGYIMRVL